MLEALIAAMRPQDGRASDLVQRCATATATGALRRHVPIVAAIRNEAAIGRAQRWLVDLDPAELAISEWTLTDTPSSLSTKLRAGLLTLEQRCCRLLTPFI